MLRNQAYEKGFKTSIFNFLKFDLFKTNFLFFYPIILTCVLGHFNKTHKKTEF